METEWGLDNKPPFLYYIYTMNKKELGSLTYSSEEVLNLTIRNLESQIADAEREKILLEGKISALQSTLTNMKYMRSHRQ